LPIIPNNISCGLDNTFVLKIYWCICVFTYIYIMLI
jgi:hypothetical protein